MKLLAEAERALGRLDGVVKTVHDEDFFVAMNSPRSGLELADQKPQSAREDLLAAELSPSPRDVPDDVRRWSITSPLWTGLGRLAELPLSLRLIREVQGDCLRVGEVPTPRLASSRSQNWIGADRGDPGHRDLRSAPPDALGKALWDFERYLQEEVDCRC